MLNLPNFDLITLLGSLDPGPAQTLRTVERIEKRDRKGRPYTVRVCTVVPRPNKYSRPHQGKQEIARRKARAA